MGVAVRHIIFSFSGRAVVIADSTQCPPLGSGVPQWGEHAGVIRSFQVGCFGCRQLSLGDMVSPSIPNHTLIFFTVCADPDPTFLLRAWSTPCCILPCEFFEAGEFVPFLLWHLQSGLARRTQCHFRRLRFLLGPETKVIQTKNNQQQEELAPVLAAPSRCQVSLMNLFSLGLFTQPGACLTAIFGSSQWDT